MHQLKKQRAVNSMLSNNTFKYLVTHKPYTVERIRGCIFPTYAIVYEGATKVREVTGYDNAHGFADLMNICWQVGAADGYSHGHADMFEFTKDVLGKDGTT